MGANITSKVDVSGSVNTNIPGTYKLQYKITYSGNSKTVNRNVTVIATKTTSTTTSNTTNVE